jgi:hypothetical protein
MAKKEPLTWLPKRLRPKKAPIPATVLGQVLLPLTASCFSDSLPFVS